MDIIITLTLIIIAICMIFGKPIKIEIHHKYDPAEIVPIEQDTEQSQLDKSKGQDKDITFDEVISILNNQIMGVDINDANR